MKKRTSICAILLALAPATHAWSATSEYEWKPIEKSALLSDVNVTGRVIPQDGALNIESARVQGRVLGILRREGESVSEGTPLYSISSVECFSLLEEKRVAASKQLQELVDGVEKREKQLGLKLEGNQCFAVASHAGILTKRNLESGASFNAGDPLANTLDTRRLTIELDIPERDQARVNVHQKVTFQFASNPGETFTAQVLNVVPTIDPTSRTSKARLTPVRLPKNVSLDALVFGEVDTGHHEPILKVPSSALVFFHNQQFVVAGGDAKPAAVPILVISETDNQSAVRPVKEGTLHEGDLIATKGAIFLLRKLMTDGLP
jgi:multidrug efflux pump subunit AcrA (membrane-fusion protein)